MKHKDSVGVRRSYEERRDETARQCESKKVVHKTHRGREQVKGGRLSVSRMTREKKRDAQKAA